MLRIPLARCTILLGVLSRISSSRLPRRTRKALKKAEYGGYIGRREWRRLDRVFDRHPDPDYCHELESQHTPGGRAVVHAQN